MNTGFTFPIKIHDVTMGDELLYGVLTILGSVCGFDQIAIHGFYLQKIPTGGLVLKP
jgi:hypothetical protein